MIGTYLLLLNSRGKYTHLLPAPFIKWVKMVCEEDIQIYFLSIHGCESYSLKIVSSGSFLMRPSEVMGFSQRAEPWTINSPIEISVTWATHITDITDMCLYCTVCVHCNSELSFHIYKPPSWCCTVLPPADQTQYRNLHRSSAFHWCGWPLSPWPSTHLHEWRHLDFFMCLYVPINIKTNILVLLSLLGSGFGTCEMAVLLALWVCEGHKFSE